MLDLELSDSIKPRLYCNNIYCSMACALNLTCQDTLDLIVLCAEALGPLVANWL